jgi:uncharacterized OsmC-like protein
MIHNVLPSPVSMPLKPPAEGDRHFSVALSFYDDYAQVVDFGMPGVALLAIDEPAPLGHGRGPEPARVLAAAIGSCLGSSLLFCLRKARIEVEDLHTEVRGTIARNASGRLRIASIHVQLAPAIPAADIERLHRCVELFEDFCVVTESVRGGIDITVDVAPVAKGASHA